MDQMAMAQAVMAIRSQAEAWLATTKEALAAAGHGFTAEDDAAIAAAAQAHPFPAGHGPGTTPSPEVMAQAQAVAQQAMTAEYPPNGFPADDPRLAPIEGVSLAIHAIAAKAIGWAPADDPITDRVATALGVDPAVFRRAAEAWSKRCADDVVLATFYGQLFSQA